MMKLLENPERSAERIGELTDVWERSVRATHHFLSENEVLRIKEYIPAALRTVPVLIAAQDDSGMMRGFMGIDGCEIAMLFLAPEARGNGLGRQLIQHAIAAYGATEVTVNEQNPQALGFYRHMGFCVYRRTETDDQGAPYPILYMRRTNG